MTDEIVFPEKDVKPTPSAISQALGRSESLWVEIERYIISVYPAVTREWKFPGVKYGWSYRLKDRKRVIIYMIPQRGFFRVALVFGEAATKEVLRSDVDAKIKDDLKNARAYVEGRGIRIDVTGKQILRDIYRLIDIKLS